MNTTVFINPEDILHFTTVSGNIDEYNFLPHIYSAQILYLEPILGSDLYSKIETLIENNTLNDSVNINYKTLLSDYITPSIVYHTMEIFVPLNAFKITNGGVSQHTPSNAQVSTLTDIDRISNRYKIIGAKYDQKLQDYLCKNQTLFVEYITNTGLVKKTETSPRIGWNLNPNIPITKIRI